MTGCPKVGELEVVAAKLRTASEPPIAQRKKARTMRRLEMPDSASDDARRRLGPFVNKVDSWTGATAELPVMIGENI